MTSTAHSPLPPAASATALDPRAEPFYVQVLQALDDAGIPFLVGGAFALAGLTGVERPTKDLDLFLRRADFDRLGQVLAGSGLHTELTFPHWLGKVYSGPFFIDLIFASANGLNAVDDGWFERAGSDTILGRTVRTMSAEDMVWSKAYIMERERYDGADVAHVLRACAPTLDWPHLMQRAEAHWRVLLAHLVLFGFIYPDERDRVPAWVMHELLQRLQAELLTPPPASGRCQGTLLSREQYLPDLQHGAGDARLQPAGTMSEAEIAAWTAAIDSPPDKDAPDQEPSRKEQAP
ncbi:nucleotidyltransferase family protein [Azohydromonas aeria]|uniref:nucleotidyltransferase family protein n=1 Tax=Azohydromonas aeria TaxID=2590212 RepID=UPI0012F896F9|nr:nucleotidyltransferase family protein [Azohydromonas aeria]